MDVSGWEKLGWEIAYSTREWIVVTCRRCRKEVTIRLSRNPMDIGSHRCDTRAFRLFSKHHRCKRCGISLTETLKWYCRDCGTSVPLLQWRRDRDRNIFWARRLSGLSLAELARQYRVSKERIRQIYEHQRRIIQRRCGKFWGEEYHDAIDYEGLGGVIDHS